MGRKNRMMAYNPAKLGNPLVVPFNAEGFQLLQEEMEMDEPGEVWEVRFIEMTMKELLELPEHEGW